MPFVEDSLSQLSKVGEMSCLSKIFRNLFGCQISCIYLFVSRHGENSKKSERLRNLVINVI